MHVWRAELTDVAQDTCSVLSVAEQARAQRIIGARRRELWVRSRALLRTLLALYLEADPRSLRFCTNAHGKPSLARPRTAAGPPSSHPERGGELSFNLSHSGDLAVYAFARTTALGVDVERLGRARPEPSLAARAFGPAQADRLARMAPQARREEFLRAWTRREAALKCVGIGIGGEGAPRPCEPWVAELEVGPGAMAAVAAETPPLELRCWEWPTERACAALRRS